jgi:hypothetical protein
MNMILTPPFYIVPAKGRPYFIISFIRAIVASTPLIWFCNVLQLQGKLSKKIIQFECMLALTISDSSCFLPPSLPPLVLKV